MSDHIDPSLALAWAALPAEDPERRTAWEHAQQCPTCRALIDEGMAMLRLIDAADAPPAVDPTLKARIKATVFARDRFRVHWELPLALVALVSLALALFDGHLGRPLAVGIGLHCLLYEAALGMLPGGAMFLLARRGLVELQPLRVGTLAAAFGLVGQLVLRVRCPVHDAAAHLLVFHCGGIAIATLLGGFWVRFTPWRN
jgi:hypothetical protein